MPTSCGTRSSSTSASRSLSMLLAVVVSFPLALLARRSRSPAGRSSPVAGVLYTIPALALIASLYPLLRAHRLAGGARAGAVRAAGAGAQHRRGPGRGAGRRRRRGQGVGYGRRRPAVAGGAPARAAGDHGRGPGRHRVDDRPADHRRLPRRWRLRQPHLRGLPGDGGSRRGRHRVAVLHRARAGRGRRAARRCSGCSPRGRGDGRRRRERGLGLAHRPGELDRADRCAARCCASTWSSRSGRCSSPWWSRSRSPSCAATSAAAAAS